MYHMRNVVTHPSGALYGDLYDGDTLIATADMPSPDSAAFPAINFTVDGAHAAFTAWALTLAENTHPDTATRLRNHPHDIAAYGAETLAEWALNDAETADGSLILFRVSTPYEPLPGLVIDQNTEYTQPNTPDALNAIRSQHPNATVWNTTTHTWDPIN